MPSPVKSEQSSSSNRPSTPPTPAESPVKVLPPSQPSTNKVPIDQGKRQVPERRSSERGLAKGTNTGVELLPPRITPVRSTPNAGKELLPASNHTASPVVNTTDSVVPPTAVGSGIKRDLPPHVRPASAGNGTRPFAGSANGKGQPQVELPSRVQPPSRTVSVASLAYRPSSPAASIQVLGSGRSAIPADPLINTPIPEVPPVPPSTSTPSLLARLGPSSLKRARDTSPVALPSAEAAETPRVSLLERLSSGGDRNQKRARESPQGGSGLAGRISRNIDNQDIAKPASPLPAGLPAKPVTSSLIRGMASQQVAPNGHGSTPPEPLSGLKIRSSIVSSTSPATPSLSVPVAPTSLSIRNHAQASTSTPTPHPASSSGSTPFSILNRSKSNHPLPSSLTDASPAEVELEHAEVEEGVGEEEVITKKGRGFAEREQDGDILMRSQDLRNPVVRPTGSLQDRIGRPSMAGNGIGNGNGTGFAPNRGGFAGRQGGQRYRGRQY
jgi:hypothetical protein